MSKPSKKCPELDFGAIELINVSGEKLEVDGFNKVLADSIYKNCLSLDMLEIAMKINRGEKVELKKSQRNEIIAVMQNQNCGLVALARKGVIDFLRQYEATD